MDKEKLEMFGFSTQEVGMLGKYPCFYKDIKFMQMNVGVIAFLCIHTVHQRNIMYIAHGLRHDAQFWDMVDMLPEVIAIDTATATNKRLLLCQLFNATTTNCHRNCQLQKSNKGRTVCHIKNS